MSLTIEDVLSRRGCNRLVTEETKEHAKSTRRNKVAAPSAKRMRYLYEHSCNHGQDTLEISEPHVRELQGWFEYGSYALCEICAGIQPQKLNEKDLFLKQNVVIPSCKVCSAGKYIRPQVHQIPLALQNLTPSEIEALRPMSIHQGEIRAHRAGYRGHTKFTRLKWKHTSFEERAAELSEESRHRVKRAYRFLMQYNGSAFREFDKQRGQQESYGSLLPFDAIQWPHIENSLFPDLYPHRSWCDSVWLEKDEQYASSKASFIAKAYSAVLDYAYDFTLVQFVYDRWIWRTITSAQNAALHQGSVLDMCLKCRTFAPEHMKNARCVLTDVVRQAGCPDGMLTLAPNEWHWILHTALKDGLDKVAAFDIFEFGGPIAMHITHCTQQLVLGYFFGKNGNKPWAWRSHIFANKKMPHLENAKYIFLRAEIQEGEERTSQGRCAWHFHCIYWLFDVKSTMIHHSLLAHCPTDYAEVSYWMHEVQRSHAPYMDEAENRPTHWTLNGNLVVHYPLSSVEARLRPVHKISLLSLRGHQDWQVTVGDQTAAVEYLTSKMRYASKQGQKLSHLKHHRTGFSAARAFVETYRPHEAEIWASLSRMRVCIGTALSNMQQPIFAPTFDNHRAHDLFLKYLTCTIRSDAISFLEWLRMYDYHKTPVTLRRRRIHEIRPIALRYNYIMKDTAWEQYVLTQVPLRKMEDILHPDCDCVPSRLKAFVAVLRLNHKSLRVDTDDALDAFLVKECYTQRQRKNLVFHFRGLRSYVEVLCKGSLYIGEIKPVEVCLPDLSAQQLLPLVELKVAATANREAWELQHVHPACEGIIYIEGEPGVGKSTVVLHMMKWMNSESISHVILTPTGALREAYRRQCDSFHTDTFDGFTSFLDPDVYVLSRKLLQWPVVMIDEVWMLNQKQLEFLYNAWCISGKWSILVFAGDPQQMRPFSTCGEAVKLFNDTSFWQQKHAFRLIYSYRIEHDAFTFVREVRYHYPSEKWIDELCKRCLVAEGIPNANHVRWALAINESTTFLAITKRAVAELNDLVAQVLFPHETPLTHAQTAEGIVPLFKGQRLVVMQNISKESGFVNGRVGKLLAKEPGVLHVVYDDGTLAPIPLWCFDDGVYFPILRGHAVTIAKSIGTNMGHITLYMEEGISVPGAGYVAISRVRNLDALSVIGFPSYKFFRPHKMLG